MTGFERKATTVKEEIQLDLLDEGMSVNNAIIPKPKHVCKSKAKLDEAHERIKQLESELLGAAIFMAECNVYEAWSDNKDNYIVEEK